MSRYLAHLTWKRTTPDFTYEGYVRTHLIRFGGGIEIQASAAVEYRGDAELVNPEEQFVASLSSCHMLTFLVVAARSKWTVDEYVDEAVGYLEKGSDGRTWVTRVELRPRVVFSGTRVPSSEEIEALHDKAHANCFIANSVKTEIKVLVN